LGLKLVVVALTEIIYYLVPPTYEDALLELQLNPSVVASNEPHEDDEKDPGIIFDV
jgi:hypothetical protein